MKAALPTYMQVQMFLFIFPKKGPQYLTLILKIDKIIYTIHFDDVF